MTITCEQCDYEGYSPSAAVMLSRGEIECPTCEGYNSPHGEYLCRCDANDPSGHECVIDCPTCEGKGSIPCPGHPHDPTEALEASLHALQDVITSALVEIHGSVEFDGDDEENTCDVRLQVYADDPMYPQWALRWGASDYDLDHRGYWGASCIAADDDTHDIYATVAELIDQSLDAYAEQNGAE